MTRLFSLPHQKVLLVQPLLEDLLSAEAAPGKSGGPARPGPADDSQGKAVVGKGAGSLLFAHGGVLAALSAASRRRLSARRLAFAREGMDSQGTEIFGRCFFALEKVLVKAKRNAKTVICLFICYSVYRPWLYCASRYGLD